MTRTLQNLALLLLAAAIVGGCQETSEPSTAHLITLPGDAKVVAEGPGELTYQAKEDGRVFLFDVDDNLVVAARRVRAGQQFALSAKLSAATLDGRKLVEQELKMKHSHRLYFEPEQ
jgi:hypothetical protein